MKNNDPKWCYSLNEEDFTGGLCSKEDAISEGREYAIDDDKPYFYIGKAISDFTPSIDIDCIIENIQEDAYQNGGEWAEGYLEDITKEQANELDEKLNDVLSNWIDKYNIKANWFTVADIERIEIKTND